jgi:hypothetical protein
MDEFILNRTSVSDNKKISRVILYPDGIQRVLTLKKYEWEWVNIAVNNGYPFDEILDAAQILAFEFPSGNGSSKDILADTRMMLRVIMEGLYEDQFPVANDIKTGN